MKIGAMLFIVSLAIASLGLVFGDESIEKNESEESRQKIEFLTAEAYAFCRHYQNYREDVPVNW